MCICNKTSLTGQHLKENGGNIGKFGNRMNGVLGFTKPLFYKGHVSNDTEKTKAFVKT